MTPKKGDKSYKITAGVPQGSILDPVLWNAGYDGISRLKLPPGVKLVGFADDVTLVVYGKRLQNGESTRRASNIALVLTSSYLMLPRVKR